MPQSISSYFIERTFNNHIRYLCMLIDRMSVYILEKSVDAGIPFFKSIFYSENVLTCKIFHISLSLTDFDRFSQKIHMFSLFIRNRILTMRKAVLRHKISCVAIHKIWDSQKWSIEPFFAYILFVFCLNRFNSQDQS